MEEEPGDFDGCWDHEAVDFDELEKLEPLFLDEDDLSTGRPGQKAKYRGELFMSGWPADAAGTRFLDYFQSDEDEVPKGIVRIDL